MIFSYNWLQNYITKNLPKPKELAELLSEHFTEVEGVEKIGNDFALDINVKPNRAGDCFSHWGIARECAAITGLKTKIPVSKLKEENNIKSSDFIRVDVKDKDACPRYMARVMTGIKVKPSPQWLKQRLRTCGLQSINNVVDIANYVMLGTGQPLHAFDIDKLESTRPGYPKKLIVRFAKKGEKIATLDEQKFELDENILVIADERNPVAIAGIKGGEGPGIDKDTETIILESANFKPVAIRHSSKRLKLRTDASIRFEHGISPWLAEKAINRAVALLQELASGKIAKDAVDIYAKPEQSRVVTLRLNHIEKLLGIKVPKATVLRILRSLEFEILREEENEMRIKVPHSRLDVSIPQDLIEEVGRIYGYKKIPAIVPMACLIPPKRNLEIFWEEFSKDILKESGFTETYNYSFITEERAKLFRYRLSGLLEIQNPLSIEQQYLCPTLMPNLLENIRKNFRFFDYLKMFELGKVFCRTLGSESKNPKDNIVEKRTLSGFIARKDKNKAISDFRELKGILDTLSGGMGISPSHGSGQGLWYDAYKPTPEQSNLSIWNNKRCAEIKIDGEEIGFIGEIAPDILYSLKIRGAVIFFDIDFEKLQALATEEHEYRPISPYPAAVRDLSVLIPRETKVVKVLNIINRAGGALVRDVDLFDVYNDEGLPDGKKSIAFHIVYQAKDRTLKVGKINQLHQKIIDALEENLGWEVRK